MSGKLFGFLIFAQLIFNSLSYCQLQGFHEYEKHSLIKLKSMINNNFQNNIEVSKIIQQNKISDAEKFQIAGGVCALGFIVSTIIFKQDIFSTIPLSFLASGIVLVFLGASM